MISWFYSGLFWLMIFAWPLSLSEKVAQPFLGIALTLNTATAMFVIYQCSSKELGFIRGIDIIAGSCMSGCANITILYLPLLLAIVYLIAVFHSVVSLFLGREHAQGRWLTLVEGFHQRRLNAPLNLLTHLAPPDPASIKIDPDDPQALIEAASLWEMEGEWRGPLSCSSRQPISCGDSRTGFTPRTASSGFGRKSHGPREGACPDPPNHGRDQTSPLGATSVSSNPCRTVNPYLPCSVVARQPAGAGARPALASCVSPSLQRSSSDPGGPGVLGGSPSAKTALKGEQHFLGSHVRLIPRNRTTRLNQANSGPGKPGEGLVWGVTSFCLAVKVVPPTKSGHLRWPQVTPEWAARGGGPLPGNISFDIARRRVPLGSVRHCGA